MSRPIAVVCAMEFEAAHLRALLPHVEIVVSGVGMANAAVATERLIAERAPGAVLNYGCAGAHRIDLAIGDVVVAERVVAYLDANTPVVECDPRLVAAARRVANPNVRFGIVGSADAWNRDHAVIHQLATRHQTLCEDMEAAAIGLVCRARAVPFLTIKDISNNELARSTASAEAMIAELGRDQIARAAAEFTFAVLRDLQEASPAFRAPERPRDRAPASGRST